MPWYLVCYFRLLLLGELANHEEERVDLVQDHLIVFFNIANHLHFAVCLLANALKRLNLLLKITGLLSRVLVHLFEHLLQVILLLTQTVKVILVVVLDVFHQIFPHFFQT